MNMHAGSFKIFQIWENKKYPIRVFSDKSPNPQQKMSFQRTPSLHIWRREKCAAFCLRAAAGMNALRGLWKGRAFIRQSPQPQVDNGRTPPGCE